MKTLAPLAALILALVSCASSPPLRTYAPPENLADCLSYLEAHALTPSAYILSAFKGHDVVILGEWHRFRQDPLLVQAMIPLLHTQGINTLAIEFANRADQERIDQVLGAEKYNEKLARDICLNSYLSIGLGGYQEYMDIFKAAWKVNRTRAKDSPVFRILGINDSNDWSVIKTVQDRDKPELRQKVFANSSELFWAEHIQNEVLKKGGKVLVYTGLHHAFSTYQQPMVDQGEFTGFATTRLGNFLKNMAGDKVFTIALHAPWPGLPDYEAPRVLPVNGAMDWILAKLPPDKRYFGFDTATTPLGKLSGSRAVYSQGYPGFTLADFVDGYICQGLLTDYQAVTPIPDFIDQENLAKAQAQHSDPSLRNKNPNAFNDDIKDEVQRLFKYFLDQVFRESRAIAEQGQH